MKRWSIRTALNWCLGMAVVLSLNGCDGSINFTIDGAVKNASAGEIFRGLAFTRETIDEDPDKSNKRRDLYELIATRAGVNTNAKFMKVLASNPHYSNVTIDAKQMAPGDETIDAIWVRFDVDHQVKVSVNFLQPEKRVFGPLRLNRLPILDSITMVIDGRQIRSTDSKEILLTHVLNGNADSFSNHLKRLAQARAPSTNSS